MTKPLTRQLIWLAAVWLLAAPQPGLATAGPGTAVKPVALNAPRAAAVPAANPNSAIDAVAAGQAFSDIENQLPTATKDAQLASLAGRAATLDGAIDRALAAQQAELAQVGRLLKKIHVQRHETKAEQARRAPLLARQAALMTQTAQTQILAYRADQLISAIAERRREGFSARILEQSASPLTPSFWTSLADAMTVDFSRLNAMAARVIAVAQAAPEPRGLDRLLIGVVAAVAMIVVAARLLRRLGARRPAGAPSRGPDSLAIMARVGVEVAVPILAAAAIRLGAQWGGLLAPAGDQLALAATGAVAWAAAVIALGRGLALAPEPTHRLLGIGQREAARARAALWVVAAITAAGFFVQRLNDIVGASLAATIAANCAISLAYVSAALLILVSFGGNDTSPTPGAQAAQGPRGSAWTLISLTLGAAIVATVGAVLLGYTTLAALIANQIFWLSLLGAAAFLALRLVDDLLGSLFREQGHLGLLLHQFFGLRTSTILQVGLLVSAALQVLIILAVVLLAVTPFGESGELLIRHIGELGNDIRLGKFTISPAGVAGGIITLIIGTALAHLVRGWVERRYLPVTPWDAGLRNSVSTGVTYLGIGLAVACALAVTGVGLQQIALVAGALSVGIGFGLQQIVQNFVAGIILLIERPVKVGDWVSVGGVEGDILRIRVRATDIRTLDGSTMIVPNSSLITMNVENKTLGEPHVRIQLQVVVARRGDATRALEVMLELMKARSDVLQTPAPAVLVDGLVAGGGATLNALVYVTDPRAANRIKSDLYIALLEALEQSGIGT